MFSRLIVIAILFLSGLAVSGQKASILGKVKDKSGELLIGANIKLKGTVRGVQSNTNGEYVIKGLNAGEYAVVVSLIGLKTEEFSVTLKDNE